MALVVVDEAVECESASKFDPGHSIAIKLI
jgi:hypothetical protein